MKSLFILLLAVTALSWSAQPLTYAGKKNQTLTGLVSEQSTNTPLSAVKITLLANGKTIAATKTKKDGTYAARVAAGKYEAIFSLPGFETNRVLNVMVTKSAASYCDVQMQKSALPGQSVTWEWAQKPHGTTEKTRTKSERSADAKHYADGVELAPFSVTMMDDLVPMLEGKASGVAVRSPEPMKSYDMSPHRQPENR